MTKEELKYYAHPDIEEFIHCTILVQKGTEIYYCTKCNRSETYERMYRWCDHYSHWIYTPLPFDFIDPKQSLWNMIKGVKTLKEHRVELENEIYTSYRLFIDGKNDCFEGDSIAESLLKAIAWQLNVII